MWGPFPAATSSFVRLARLFAHLLARGPLGVVKPAQRRIQFPPHLIERRGQRGAPPNQHIIMTAVHAAACGQPHDLAQPAPYPVALHRIADLPRHREADPRRTVLGAAAGLHHEGAAGRPQPLRRSEKVGAAGQPLHGNAATAVAAIDHALSRLRPRARRAASTLRPPVVAIRVRKP
jgi:hypothetical protein